VWLHRKAHSHRERSRRQHPGPGQDGTSTLLLRSLGWCLRSSRHAVHDRGGIRRSTRPRARLHRNRPSRHRPDRTPPRAIARVGVIRKFQEMIEKDIPEKPDMQDFLFEHPWLIDPEWLVVEHEKGLETLLVEHFKLDRTANSDSDKRVDFFCISSRGRYLVVE